MPVSQLKMQNHIDGYKSEHVGIASDLLGDTKPENCLMQRQIKAKHQCKTFVMSSLHSSIKIWLRNS